MSNKPKCIPVERKKVPVTLTAKLPDVDPKLQNWIKYLNKKQHAVLEKWSKNWTNMRNADFLSLPSADLEILKSTIKHAPKVQREWFLGIIGGSGKGGTLLAATPVSTNIEQVTANLAGKVRKGQDFTIYKAEASGVELPNISGGEPKEGILEKGTKLKVIAAIKPSLIEDPVAISSLSKDLKKSISVGPFDDNPVDAPPPKLDNWVSSLDREQKTAINDWADTFQSASVVRAYESGTLKEFGKKEKWEPSTLSNNEKWAKRLIKNMSTSYQTAPKFEGALYRGLNSLPVEAFNSMTSVGSEVSLDAWTSFSRSPKLASKYAKKGNKLKVYIKNSSNGMSVEGVTGHAKSEEVVVPKGTKYKVVGFDEKEGVAVWEEMSTKKVEIPDYEVDKWYKDIDIMGVKGKVVDVKEPPTPKRFKTDKQFVNFVENDEGVGQAIADYTNGYAGQIRQHQQGIYEGPDKGLVKEAINGLQKAYDKTPLYTGEVHRGMKLSGDAAKLWTTPGNKIEFNSWQSFSSEKDIAKQFGDHVFTMKTKRGMNLTPVLDDEAKEFEIMLPRGNQIKVLSSKKVGSRTYTELEEVGSEDVIPTQPVAIAKTTLKDIVTQNWDSLDESQLRQSAAKLLWTNEKNIKIKIEKAASLEALRSLGLRVQSLYKRHGEAFLSKMKKPIDKSQFKVSFQKEIEKNPNIGGMLRPSLGTLQVIPNIMKGKDFSPGVWATEGGTTQTTARLVHEYGHLIEQKLKGKLGTARDLFLSKPKEYWSQVLTKYGATNEGELFAEAFSVYSDPNYVKGTLPPELENMVIKVLE